MVIETLSQLKAWLPDAEARHRPLDTGQCTCGWRSISDEPSPYTLQMHLEWAPLRELGDVLASGQVASDPQISGGENEHRLDEFLQGRDNYIDVLTDLLDQLDVKYPPFGDYIDVEPFTPVHWAWGQAASA